MWLESFETNIIINNIIRALRTIDPTSQETEIILEEATRYAIQTGILHPTSKLMTILKTFSIESLEQLPVLRTDQATEREPSIVTIPPTSSSASQRFTRKTSMRTSRLKPKSKNTIQPPSTGGRVLPVTTTSSDIRARDRMIDLITTPQNTSAAISRGTSKNKVPWQKQFEEDVLKHGLSKEELTMKYWSRPRFPQHYAMLKSTTVKRLPFEPELFVIWGDTNLGKTSSALNAADAFQMSRFLYVLHHNLWFDDYQHEDVLILDEFDPEQYKLTFLNYLISKHPASVEIKGGTVKIRPKCIIALSNLNPENWWSSKPSALKAAIQRRIHSIHINSHHDAVMSALLVLTYTKHQCTTTDHSKSFRFWYVTEYQKNPDLKKELTLLANQIHSNYTQHQFESPSTSIHLTDDTTPTPAAIQTTSDAQADPTLRSYHGLKPSTRRLLKRAVATKRFFGKDNPAQG